MTTPRIDWTAVERNGVYYNFKGVTAEGLTLTERGWRPQVVGVDKPGDYRVKLFADTTGVEEGETLEIQLRQARLEFTCEADGLLQVKFVDSSSLYALVTQARPAGSGAEAPEGMIDACLEGTFSTEIIKKGEHGGRCEGDFPEVPEWMGEGVRVFITPEPYVRGGGTELRVVCPNASRRVLGRLKHLRINGVWMPWMPYSYGDGYTGLYLCPDPRDADQIRDYEGELIPNEAPPMRDTHNLRPFFYKYISGARPYRNWTGKAREIYGPWREAVYEYQRYSHLGVTYGQWKLYQEAAARDYVAAKKKSDAAEQIYRRRPPAYADYLIEPFAEETKNEKRWGAVYRLQNEAKACVKGADKAQAMADYIMDGADPTPERPEGTPGLRQCYAAKDKWDQILIAFEDEYRDQITAYFSM